MRSLKYFLRNPKDILIGVMTHTATLWPDKLYLRIRYYLQMGKPLHLNNPKSFTEKLQWLKINNIRPEYTRMVDKYEVKSYVREKLGSDEIIIPTYGVWSSFDEIDFDALPEKFVLKTTNGGGGNQVIRCLCKSAINKEEARRKLCLGTSGKKVYAWAREYPYYGIEPRIIAEMLLDDPSGDLKDYKFFCFNGKVRFLKIDSERFKDHHVTYLFPNWERTPFSEASFPATRTIPYKPVNLNKMIEIAEKLSRGIPFVRVDLYNINGKIYFSELTFFPNAGYDGFSPDGWDEKIGDYLQLNK